MANLSGDPLPRGTNANVINIFTSHCEPEGDGHFTPSPPSPLEGEGKGGGELLRCSAFRNDRLFIAFVLGSFSRENDISLDHL